MSNECGLGSNSHKESAIERFEETFEKIIELMKVSRSVELRLRIYYEVIKHRDHNKGKEFDQFVNSKFGVDRRAFNRLLTDLIPKEKMKRFQDIREILDALAHADYLKARKKINEFSINHSEVSPLNNEPYPERVIEGLRSESGEPENYARLIKSTGDNLTVEEYQVFEHQGYVNFAKELILEVNEQFPDNENIGWIYELLSISRVYKYGQKYS